MKGEKHQRQSFFSYITCCKIAMEKWNGIFNIYKQICMQMKSTENFIKTFYWLIYFFFGGSR